ncbi:MAG TPA: pyruvate kinase [bacterium]|nr:pyruvate kinase [bacterium]HOQ91689.1 pyruvate kinase [bacterium]
MHTRIIATVGPQSFSYPVLSKLVTSGVDIIRLNFSHAKIEQLNDLKNNLQRIKEETDCQTKIMQDLQGPRIRIGRLDQEIELVDGETYVFTGGQASLANQEIPIDDPDLYQDLRIGDPIFLANGELELKIVDIKDKMIYARVERGGLLMSHKGINLPNTNLTRGGLTKKDIADVEAAFEYNVDYIALSFVQSADDLRRLRKIIGNRPIGLIAKIERAIALEVIDEIIKESDGIMVARGDLGIELPMEDLPIIQKNLVRHAHWHGKPAIIATQMMTSMIEHPRPTRAEVSDIANAVLAGADALMLSDETAVGLYPNQAVAAMKKIICRTESYLNNRNYFDTETAAFYCHYVN